MRGLLHRNHSPDADRSDARRRGLLQELRADSVYGSLIPMHYPQRIRLRGPWECVPPAESSNSFTIHLPASLSHSRLAGVTGWVRLTRNFGYPGRIDADESVWLVIPELAMVSSIKLND